MDIEELKKNKLFWVVVVVSVLNLGYFFGGKVLIDKIANRVIEKLQKEYSPSPYGPGVDPDKVDPRSLQQKVFEMHQSINGPVVTGSDVEDWRTVWERDRGN